MTILQHYPSGRVIDFDRFSAREFTIHDVARPLSLIPRFGGQTVFPYSVAQHCLAVAEILGRGGFDASTRLLGLLHGAEEAFFGDLATPIKARLPAHDQAQRRDIRFRLIDALAGPWLFSKPADFFAALTRVEEADRWCLYAERRALQPMNVAEDIWPNNDKRPADWIATALGVPHPHDYNDVPTTPPVQEAPWRNVEYRFMYVFRNLLDERERVREIEEVRHA